MCGYYMQNPCTVDQKDVKILEINIYSSEELKAKAFDMSDNFLFLFYIRIFVCPVKTFYS